MDRYFSKMGLSKLFNSKKTTSGTKNSGSLKIIYELIEAKPRQQNLHLLQDIN